MTLVRAFREILREQLTVPVPYWLDEVSEWVVIAAAVVGLLVLAVIA